MQDSWAALDEDGNATGNACFASGWYDYLTKRVNDMIRHVSSFRVNASDAINLLPLMSRSYTNISVLEMDGPYGGYSCSSKKHPHHEGAADSVYWQNRRVVCLNMFVCCCVFECGCCVFGGEF